MSFDHLGDVELDHLTERMTDVCRVSAPGSEVFDEVTDTMTPTVGAVRYEGPCWVNMAAVPTKPGEFGGQQVQIDTARGRLPGSAVGVKEGDKLEVIDSRDPELIGATFDVADIRHSTFTVTRILQLRRRNRTHPTV